MNYQLKIAGVQDDFNRYRTLAESFDADNIYALAIKYKGLMKKYLDIFRGLDSSIIVNLVSNGKYDYNIVFDFEMNDVYVGYKEGSKKYYILYSDDNKIGCQDDTLQQTEKIDDQVLKFYVKPIIMLFLMYYKEVNKFLYECVNRILEIDQEISKIKEEQKAKEKIETDEQKTEA